MNISAEEIRRKSEEFREQIITDRRYLHRIPEIGTDLPQTSSYIKKKLDEMGIPWKDCGGRLPAQMTCGMARQSWKGSWISTGRRTESTERFISVTG